jgi:hypothetical protein
MASMIPKIDYLFKHVPLEGKVAVLDHDYEFPWLQMANKFPLYDENHLAPVIRDDIPPSVTTEKMSSLDWHRRQKELLSACVQAYNPWSGVSRELRKRLDQGLPATNAFCKMYEMCFVDEVKAVLHEHGEKGKSLSIACLAEAPALFPIAIMYYLGNRFPIFLDLNKFQYQCTTLPLDIESEASLPDQFSLISANIKLWHFMDHTSAKDTRGMIAALGSGSRDLVTGDIGKPTATCESAERDKYREELGQLVSACALLKDKGVAVLKMFSAREYSTACMLRLAIGLFDQVRIFKPLTSRPSNIETYWIMSGFKRDLFGPLLEPLLAVMDNATAALAAASSSTTASMTATASTASTAASSMTAAKEPKEPREPKESKGSKESKESKEQEKDPKEVAALIPHYRGFLVESNFSKVFSDQILRLLTCQHLRNRPFLRQGIIELERNRGRKDDPYTIQVGIMKSLAPMTYPYVEKWLTSFPISKLGAIFYRLSNIPVPSGTSSRVGWNKSKKVPTSIEMDDHKTPSS